jgi:hypothetical protein
MRCRAGGGGLLSSGPHPESLDSRRHASGEPGMPSSSGAGAASRDSVSVHAQGRHARLRVGPDRARHASSSHRPASVRLASAPARHRSHRASLCGHQVIQQVAHRAARPRASATRTDRRSPYECRQKTARGQSYYSRGIEQLPSRDVSEPTQWRHVAAVVVRPRPAILARSQASRPWGGVIHGLMACRNGHARPRPQLLAGLRKRRTGRRLPESRL